MRNSSAYKKLSMVFILPFIWMVSSLALIFLILMLLLNLNPSTISSSMKYVAFAAKPLVLGAMTSRLETNDAKAQRIDAVYKQFKCPMYGMGNTIVEEANKNNIPYWLVAAISFQESSCGKNTPFKDGLEETYNAWGWGVWGPNLKHFDSWEHGIQTVSKYMGDKFYSKGITDTCEIMKVYTPPSKGSWCNGVNYFGDLIQNFTSK